MSDKLVIPTFTEAFFRFDNPSSVPVHHDAEPTSPNYVGFWSVYMSTGLKALTSALDVLDPDQAELLAAAKRDYLESTIEVYGYTTDVVILSPDGTHTKFYNGRSLL